MPIDPVAVAGKRKRGGGNSRRGRAARRKLAADAVGAGEAKMAELREIEAMNFPQQAVRHELEKEKQ